MTLLGALQPYVAAKGVRTAVSGCELCGARLDAEHSHLADVELRALACACRSCALLFDRRAAMGASSAAVRTRWRTIPDRHLVDPTFAFRDEEWEELGIPVSMAFFFKSSVADAWTAVYPSPAGPVESHVRLEAWAGIATRTRLVNAVEADVEALLVNHDRDRYECLLVPIHSCYALIGHVRRRWRGLDGGEEARGAIGAYLDALRARCELVEPGDVS